MKLGQWLGFAGIIASMYILWQVRQAILLVFAAIVLATVLNKLARKFQRIRIGRSLAVLLSVGLFVLLFVGGFLVVVPPLLTQFQELGTQVPRGLERGLYRFDLWIDYLKTQVPFGFREYLYLISRDMTEIDVSQTLTQLQGLGNQVVGGVGVFVGTTIGAILSILLVLILTIMLLASPQAYRQAFIRLIPSFYRDRMNEILDRCEFAIGRWVIGAVINMSVVTLCSLIGLWILQIPLAFANAILAGFLNFVPNVGPVISVIPPMAIALLYAPWKMWFVLLLYVVIQQLETAFLIPYVMATQVALLPAFTLLAQGFFLKFFGFLGLFLALPLAVVGQVLIKEILIRDILDNL
ncbi:MAG: AI-2E family transporter [Cyanobacteriota bacterium]|nr:AI-2E family transporter [Cyanobacteriota bacterium]